MRDLITSRALYTALALFGGAGLILLTTWLLRRHSKRAASIPFWLILLRVAGMATLLLALGCQVRDAPWNLLNDHRLAPSASVLKGYSAYYPPEQGPALSSIYGPVMIALHLPSASFTSPSVQVGVGTAVNILVFYVPLFVLLWATRRLYPARSSLDLLLVMFAFTLVNKALSSSSGGIHADAPAIGFGIVAAAFAIQCAATGKWQHAGFAGVFSVLSIFSKQNMAPAIPVMAVYLLLVCTWRGLLAYTASLLGAGFIILLATFAWLGNWQAVSYNLLYIPSHQIYIRAELLPALQLLIEMSFWFVLIAAGGLYLRLTAAAAGVSTREWLRLNPSALLLAAGFALCTTSILGKIKVVGSNNAISPAVYFFLMACILELAATPWSLNPVAETRMKGRNALVVVTLLVLVLAYLPVSIYRTLNSRQSSPMELVYNYSRKQPGDLYFPQFPLSTLLAENQLYHFSWGLADRAEAGKPLSGEYFRKHIPPRARVAAMVDWVWDAELFRYLGKEVQRSDLEDLPGFRFYEIRDRPLTAAEWPLHHNVDDRWTPDK